MIHFLIIYLDIKRIYDYLGSYSIFMWAAFVFLLLVLPAALVSGIWAQHVAKTKTVISAPLVAGLNVLLAAGICVAGYSITYVILPFLTLPPEPEIVMIYEVQALVIAVFSLPVISVFAFSGSVYAYLRDRHGYQILGDKASR